MYLCIFLLLTVTWPPFYPNTNQYLKQVTVITCNFSIFQPHKHSVRLWDWPNSVSGEVTQTPHNRATSASEEGLLPPARDRHSRWWPQTGCRAEGKTRASFVLGYKVLNENTNPCIWNPTGHWRFPSPWMALFSSRTKHKCHLDRGDCHQPRGLLLLPRVEPRQAQATPGWVLFWEKLAEIEGRWCRAGRGTHACSYRQPG